MGRRAWTGKQWCGERIGKGAVQQSEMCRQREASRKSFTTWAGEHDSPGTYSGMFPEGAGGDESSTRR